MNEDKYFFEEVKICNKENSTFQNQVFIMMTNNIYNEVFFSEKTKEKLILQVNDYFFTKNLEEGTRLYGIYLSGESDLHSISKVAKGTSQETSVSPVMELMQGTLKKSLRQQLAYNVDQELKRRGITNAVLSENLNASPSAISQTRNGNNSFSGEDIAWLHTKFQIPINVIFKGIESIISGKKSEHFQSSVIIDKSNAIVKSNSFQELINTNNTSDSIKDLLKAINYYTNKNSELKSLTKNIKRLTKLHNRTSIETNISIEDLQDDVDNFFDSLMKARKEGISLNSIAEAISSLNKSK